MIKQTTPCCEPSSPKPNVVTLDVREDLRKGREPFSRIMSTVASLGDEDQLLLIAPFEPTPLFRVLGQQGFSHTARTTEAGDWEVLFRREAAGTADQSPTQDDVEDASRRHEPVAEEAEIEVDARGLEPPQPLVKILEAVATLPAGARLRARTDRRPMHLYSELEERGFVAETKEESDGSFVTHICRR